MVKRNSGAVVDPLSAAEILKDFQQDERKREGQLAFYHATIRKDADTWSQEERQAMEKLAGVLGFSLSADISDSRFVLANRDLAVGESVDDCQTYKNESAKLDEMVGRLRELEAIANLTIPQLRADIKQQNQVLIRVAGRYQKLSAIANEKPYLFE